MRTKGPRIFLGDIRFAFSHTPAQQITCPPEQSHYIRDVLRMAAGDSLEIGDSQSGEIASAQILTLEGRVVVEITGRVDSSSSLSRHVVLLCALCKGDKNEQICDWATELGCHEIHFWQSPRSIIRLRSDEERVRKTERLNKIALAAAQQSRQPRPTLVAIHATLQDALVNIPAIQKGCALVCSLRPEAAPIANRLSAEANRPVVIAIGPEGDFAPEEYDTLCIEHNFIPITLGPSILRSELAVVAALSAIRMIELR